MRRLGHQADRRIGRPDLEPDPGDLKNQVTHAVSWHCANRRRDWWRISGSGPPGPP